MGEVDWHDLKPDFVVAEQFALLFPKLTASTVAEVVVVIEEELIAGESTEVVELVEAEVFGEEEVVADLVGILALLQLFLCFL